MKNPLLTTATAVALLWGASTAAAAQFVNFGPMAPDGSFSGTFGNTGIANPTFTDTFEFVLPTGTSSFVATSTFSGNQRNNIDFTSIRFNGMDFLIGSTGQTEVRFLNGIPVTAGAAQQLIVAGTNGGSGSYSGVVTFTPDMVGGGAVPEPSAWALMILGFGGAGAMLRRRGRGGRFSVASTAS